MKGLRLRPEKRDGWDTFLPTGKEPFELFFFPALSELPPLYWFLGIDSAYSYYRAAEAFGDDYIESLYVDEITQACIRDNVQIGVALLRPAFLPKFAPFINTDHNSIMGLTGDESSVKKIVYAHIERLWNGRENPQANYDFIIQHAPIYFNCDDGLWWDVYTPTESILSTIRIRLQNLRGLIIENLDEQTLRQTTVPLNY